MSWREWGEMAQGAAMIGFVVFFLLCADSCRKKVTLNEQPRAARTR